MDRQVAEFAVSASFRASSELIRFLDLAKLHCSKEDYEELKLRIATAIAEIGEVDRWAHKSHPELQGLVNERLEKYGRFC